MFNGARDRAKVRKNRARAEQLMRESQIRKAYGVDVSDDKTTISIAPSENPVRSLWKIMLSVIQAVTIVVIAALALIGLVALLQPDTRSILSEQLDNTVQNISELTR